MQIACYTSLHNVTNVLVVLSLKTHLEPIQQVQRVDPPESKISRQLVYHQGHGLTPLGEQETVMDMDQTIELTLEQDLSLRNFADLVQQMSCEQARDFLIEQQRLMMLQKTMYQEILKQEWKLGSDFAAR